MQERMEMCAAGVRTQFEYANEAKKKKGGNGICMIIASVAHVLQHSSELMLTLRGRLPCCRRFPSCHNKLYGLTAFI